MTTRRKFLAGTAALPFAFSSASAFGQLSTPAASPVATPVAMAPTSDQVVPAWLEAQATLREWGEVASEAFWNADTEALVEMGTPEIAAAFQGGPGIDQVIESFTRDQIHFAFHEVGARFFGQFTPEKIAGTFTQGGALPWEALPDEPQTGDVPAGSWTGVIGPGVLNLGIQLTFSGDADTLEVILSIPSQFLLNAPMQEVVFAADIPIGEMVDERVIPAGGDVTIVNNYAEEHEWGSNTLVLDTYWTGDGKLAGLNLVPKVALPDDSAHEPIVARLPFDGAWLIVWGGDTEFQNYHAPVAAQRYAADILLWQNGSTAVAPGTENQHYHAFGQPYLAPVSGTVVSVLDGLDDITPQQPGNPGDHVAGNHVVIEVDGAFVFLAHCKNGSIVVQPGDAVEAGDPVAAIGNSGNTSEPHVHIHAQSTADIYDPNAVGIPMTYENVLVNGELQASAMPLHGTIMEQSS